MLLEQGREGRRQSVIMKDSHNQEGPSDKSVFKSTHQSPTSKKTLVTSFHFFPEEHHLRTKLLTHNPRDDISYSNNNTVDLMRDEIGL